MGNDAGKLSVATDALTKRLDRFAQFAVNAAIEAIAKAGIALAGAVTELHYAAARHRSIALAATIAELDKQLLAEMAKLDLTPANDTMPEDAGIKAELPDQKIR